MSRYTTLLCAGFCIGHVNWLDDEQLLGEPMEDQIAHGTANLFPDSGLNFDRDIKPNDAVDSRRGAAAIINFYR